MFIQINKLKTLKNVLIATSALGAAVPLTTVIAPMEAHAAAGVAPLVGANLTLDQAKQGALPLLVQFQGFAATQAEKDAAVIIVQGTQAVGGAQAAAINNVLGMNAVNVNGMLREADARRAFRVLTAINDYFVAHPTAATLAAAAGGAAAGAPVVAAAPAPAVPPVVVPAPVVAAPAAAPAAVDPVLAAARAAAVAERVNVQGHAAILANAPAVDNAIAALRAPGAPLAAVAEADSVLAAAPAAVAARAIAAPAVAEVAPNAHPEAPVVAAPVQQVIAAIDAANAQEIHQVVTAALATEESAKKVLADPDAVQKIVSSDKALDAALAHNHVFNQIVTDSEAVKQIVEAPSVSVDHALTQSILATQVSRINNPDLPLETGAQGFQKAVDLDTVVHLATTSQSDHSKALIAEIKANPASETFAEAVKMVTSKFMKVF